MYGRVLVCSYRSVADAGGESVLRAGAAIELLRAYCRLRSELLVQFDGPTPDSVDRDRTARLLASDFLYTAAYSTLGGIDHLSLNACYRALTETSSGLARTLYEGREWSASATDLLALLDGTAGRLGEGAAGIGAALAGVDGARRDRFASIGRGLSTARRIRLAVETDGEPDRILPPTVDTDRLRRHATRQFADATDAFRRLEPVAETDRLRPLFEEIGEFEA